MWTVRKRDNSRGACAFCRNQVNTAEEGVADSLGFLEKKTTKCRTKLSLISGKPKIQGQKRDSRLDREGPVDTTGWRQFRIWGSKKNV